MKKENKSLLKYIGLIFLGVLLVYKLPYKPYSISEYFIRPIKLGSGKLYLSGVVSLILIIIGIKGLFKLERYKNTSKILIVLCLIVIVIPLMNWSLDVARTGFHLIKGDSLRAIELEDTSINLNGSKEATEITVKLELKDYSKEGNQFKLRVYLPETLSQYTEEDYYYIDTIQYTQGGRNKSKIEGTIDIDLKEGYSQTQFFESDWLGSNIEYELYNNEGKVKFTDCGF